MKVKFDENIPDEVVPLVSARHDVDTAFEESLSGANDAEVWIAAQGSARFLVTQDLDFSDLREFLPGSHHGILLIRLKNPSRSALVTRVHERLNSPESETWIGCFVVATESKLRVRRP